MIAQILNRWIRVGRVVSPLPFGTVTAADDDLHTLVACCVEAALHVGQKVGGQKPFVAIGCQCDASPDEGDSLLLPDGTDVGIESGQIGVLIKAAFRVDEDAVADLVVGDDQGICRDVLDTSVALYQLFATTSDEHEQRQQTEYGKHGFHPAIRSGKENQSF